MLPEVWIERMVEDLIRLGVRPGGILLVHSSLRALGPMPGMDHPAQRAESVIQALLAALGPRGTLLLPALSYETVGAHNPVFDVNATPACIGALPEYFRTRPGTIRSVHPTHSVCGVGERAEEILAGHLLDTTPCGPNSPFARLPGLEGQVLFLGCGLRPNTSMHAIEEQVVPPYLFGEPVDYRVRLIDGQEITMRVRSHNFRGWEQRYDRMEAAMTRGLARGTVLQADSFLLEAEQMWPAALACLRANPFHFVDPDS